jgi:cephalosporin-C deacetylase-like acetyl esterase
MKTRLTLFLPWLLASALAAQENKSSPQQRLYDFQLAKAKEHFDARRKEIANLKDPADIRKRQERLKGLFIESLGGFPEKTPLNPQITGTTRGVGFVVEKVIYESRPNHHVTANFYRPEGKGPFPGVLVPCGHSVNGKAADAYQRACILMARNGLAVLCYDPIGQGERFQNLDSSGMPVSKSTTGEHTQVGIGAWLAGTSTATYRIWDGIRSLDYLASRPEVDPTRLGCTGNSGGGTLTSYLMALDERIAVAAPSCYICSLEKLFETLGPQDAEQNIVGQVAFGMEHADYVTMRAPKPTLLCVATKDFFNIDGAWSVFREATVVYGRLGYGERVSLFEYEDTHGFSKPRREAAARWMVRWLYGKDEPIFEDDFKHFKDEELQCTRTGQVVWDLKGVSAFQMNVKLAEASAPVRAKFASLPEAQRQKEIRRLLGITRETPVAVRKDMGFETEPGLMLDAKVSAGGAEEVWLLLPEDGVPRIPEGGKTTTISLALRGLGAPGAKANPMDMKNAMLGLHLNRPLVGQRVEDVLAVLNSEPYRKAKVRLFAQGATGIVALHAAALEPRIQSVEIENMVVSWDKIVRTPTATNQAPSVVPNVLKVYDLPELALSIMDRCEITLRSCVDAQQKPIAVDDAQSTYRACYDRYHNQKKGNRFTVR